MRIEGTDMTETTRRPAQGVWVTDIPRNSTSQYGFTCEQAGEDREGFLRLLRESQAGEEIAADRFPAEMWVPGEFKEHKKLKHIFFANGLFAVSAAFAEILRRHDMGRNRLHPVTFFKKDRTTPYEGEYFLLNLCEQKAGFDPERSTEFRDGFTTYKGMLCEPAHDATAVAASVLSGADLWMDPTFLNSTFVKGPLAQELLDRRMFHSRGYGIPIARCQIVGGRA